MAKHEDVCRCWRCTSRLLGEWFDELGARTVSGHWDSFVTISYKMGDCPWRRGFPVKRWKPNPEFADNFFKLFIRHFEDTLDERLDYCVANQYGNVNGRLHQHALLAGHGLDEAMRTKMQLWLAAEAGSSRVLPFEPGAAGYLARYIGRSLPETEWGIEVGEQKMERVAKPERWGYEVVVSADMPKTAFHQGLPGRTR
jgi:hypothetical protein